MPGIVRRPEYFTEKLPGNDDPGATERATNFAAALNPLHRKRNALFAGRAVDIYIHGWPLQDL